MLQLQFWAVQGLSLPARIPSQFLRSFFFQKKVIGQGKNCSKSKTELLKDKSRLDILLIILYLVSRLQVGQNQVSSTLWTRILQDLEKLLIFQVCTYLQVHMLGVLIHTNRTFEMAGIFLKLGLQLILNMEYQNW